MNTLVMNSRVAFGEKISIFFLNLLSSINLMSIVSFTRQSSKLIYMVTSLTNF